MMAAARELIAWLGEHRAVLGLATVAAYPQLHYAVHGPPAHVVVLPALSILVFLVIPWSAAVLHDLPAQRGRSPKALAAAAGLVALAAAIAWGHGARRAILHAPDPLVLAAVVSLLLVLAASRRGFDPSAWGLGPGEIRWWSRPVLVVLVVLAVAIPVTVALFPEFASFYPRYRPARVQADAIALVQYQLAMGVYMFCWEFFFRGFMLFGLARYTGPVAAILLQAFPFFVLHHAKPEPELISSWFGGVVVGWLAWRAKSVWPTFLLHWAMYATMEISAFVTRHYG